MKYFLAQLGIIFFVILAELTTSKWISTWILVVSLMVILMLFLISSRYHEYQFQGAKRGIEIANFMLKSFGIFSVIFAILLLLYFRYGGEKFPQPIRKQLHITMKDNNPCFYIEPFVGMEAFSIYRVSIAESVMVPEGYSRLEGSWNIDMNNSILIFSGIEQCIPYGVKNELYSESSKKLETDVLYSATMEGPRNNIPKGKEEEDGNWLTANVGFYLSKNHKTGEIQVNILNEEQRVAWLTKLKNSTSKNQDKK